MRARLLSVVALLCVGMTSVARAGSIPIDSSLFTIVSAPGIASWTGNSLTLNFPVTGGFTQTGQFATSILPSNIVGISFDISSSLSNQRISFGYSTYNGAGNGQGSIVLANYLSLPTGNLTTFSSLISGLGGGRTTSDDVVVFLGPSYSPFSLNENIHNDLSTYPLFSLDFRADGYNGIDYFPGTVTFGNINWITADSLAPVPLPPSFVSQLIGLGLLGLLAWRRKRKGAALAAVKHT